MAPYSRWSTRLIGDLRQGQGILIDGGSGLCNTTYVDNLVDAVYCSLESKTALGQAFFITDGERTTWGDFIRAHAAMLQCPVPLKEISSEEILAYHRAKPGLWKSSAREALRILAGPEFRQLIKRVPVGDRLLTGLWEKFQGLSEKSKNRWRMRLRGPGSEAPQGGRLPMPDLNTWPSRRAQSSFKLRRRVASSVTNRASRLPAALNSPGSGSALRGFCDGTRPPHTCLHRAR